MTACDLHFSTTIHLHFWTTIDTSPSAAATTLPRTGGPGGPPLNLLFTLVATLTLVGAGLFALFLVRRSVEPLVRDVRKYLHRVGKG